MGRARSGRAWDGHAPIVVALQEQVVLIPPRYANETPQPDSSTIVGLRGQFPMAGRTPGQLKKPWYDNSR
jgi:hypothetical protein